jgi:hypothetical protein
MIITETFGVYLLLAGAGIAVFGWLWLLIRAFRVWWLWGTGLLLLPPLVIFFLWRHGSRVKLPVSLMLLGGVVALTPITINRYQQLYLDLGPHESTVDGELHLTLTNWDKDDYSVIAERPDAVVVQMANADVTDRTLDHLRGLKKLRELDLSDTRITDAGLEVLAELPKLKDLRLARTQITDEGFREHLFASESLMRLDLTGTAVKSRTIREWKQAKAGREVLQ